MIMNTKELIQNERKGDKYSTVLVGGLSADVACFVEKVMVI